MGLFFLLAGTPQGLIAQIDGTTDICFDEETNRTEYVYDYDWGLYGVVPHGVFYYGDKLPYDYATVEDRSDAWNTRLGVTYQRPGVYTLPATYHAIFHQDVHRSLEVRVSLPNITPNGDANLDMITSGTYCPAPTTYIAFRRFSNFAGDPTALNYLRNFGWTNNFHDFTNPVSWSQIKVFHIPSGVYTFDSGRMAGNRDLFSFGGTAPGDFGNGMFLTPGEYRIELTCQTPCNTEPQSSVQYINIEKCNPTISATFEGQAGANHTSPARVVVCNNSTPSTMNLLANVYSPQAAGGVGGNTASIQLWTTNFTSPITSGQCSNGATANFVPGTTYDIRVLFPSYSACLVPNTNHVITLNSTNRFATATTKVYLKIDGFGAYNVLFQTVSCTSGALSNVPTDNSCTNPLPQSQGDPMIITGVGNTGTVNRYWIQIDEVTCGASGPVVVRNIIDGVNEKRTLTTNSLSEIVGLSMNSYYYNVLRQRTPGSNPPRFFFSLTGNTNKLYRMRLYGENVCSGTTPYFREVFFINNVACRPAGGGPKMVETNDDAGISASENTEVTAFPNPFESSISLKVATDKEQKMLLFISDLQGKLVHQQEWQLLEGENQLEIPAQDWPQGLYIYKLGDKHVGKIMKQ